jgi:MFS transporter, PPP family, 3-phenylpropionic acid transporter
MKSIRTAYPWTIASQYFLHFGIMGVFLPYFNLYCLHIGFNGVQIGALSSVRSVSTIIFPVLFGAVADRFGVRKPIYVGCCFISAAIWTFFLRTTDFYWMLMICLLYGIFNSSIISFLEALTMDTLGREKRSYGTIRAWGSVSFIIIVMLMGKVIDLFSIRIILLCILVGSIIQAIAAVKIPYHIHKFNQNTIPKFRHFLRYRILFFLFCAFLMLVSHGAYYGFFSIHLERLGFSNLFIGSVWAIASVAEILAMLKSKPLFTRFSLETVLVFSFAVAVLRWCLLYYVTSPVPIILTQVLHAVTYGTFHMAGILYMDKMTRDDSKTMGQAVNNAVTYGLGLMVGFLVNGYLYEVVGSGVLFIISAGIAAAGGILFGTSLLLDKSNIR